MQPCSYYRALPGCSLETKQMLKTRARLAAMVVLLAGLAWLLLQDNLLASLRAQLDAVHPVLAAGLFVIAFVCGSVLLIPASVFMIAAGAYFGIGWGFVLNMLGFTLGAAVTFLISRYLARDLVLHYLPQRIRESVEGVHEHGWKLVAVLRLTGVIPSVAINYALPVTSLPLLTFSWASLVFTLPNGLILTYAGLAGDDFINGGGLRRVLIAFTLIAIMSIAGYLLRRKFTASKAQVPTPP